MKKDSTEPLHFVLLEDDPNDAELIQLQLAQNDLDITWRHVMSESDFRAALAGTPPDLVLADYTLPGFDGLTALRIVLERSADIPFIFVSGSLGEERAIEALKSGATDYVLKDRLQRLPMVVNRALSEARVRRERRRAETALEEQRVLLSTLIDSLPEIIYAVDTENRVTVVNRALLDTLNKPRDEVLGRRLSELWTEENVVDIEGQAATTMRTGRPLTDQERAWIGLDGSVRWFTFTHVPLRDHGTVSGLVCTVQEVTQRKELEQEILEISNREQRRLGSDLHDGLGQELTGLSLLMKGLEMQMARESPQYSAQVTKITDLLARAIQSTRSLARGLAPVNLERGGLAGGVEASGRSLHRHVQPRLHLHVGGQKLPDLEEGAATHLYRIAQEASTNAARYARATSINIDLRSTGRKLQLSIADDGIGLSAGLAQGRPGMGLKIMEYRARMLGGSISFDEPGAGTRIALTAPLHLLRQSKDKKRLAASG